MRGRSAPAWAGTADGLLGDWLDAVRVPALQGLSADRALLLAGAFLVQLSTGNVIVLRSDLVAARPWR